VVDAAEVLADQAAELQEGGRNSAGGTADHPVAAAL